MEFADERGGRHRFSGASRADEQEFPTGAEAMFAKHFLLAFFQENAFQTFLRNLWQRHIPETESGRLHLEQVGEFAPGLQDNELPCSVLDSGRFCGAEPRDTVMMFRRWKGGSYRSL